MILLVRILVHLLSAFVIIPIKIMISFKAERLNARLLDVNALTFTIFQYMVHKTLNVPANTLTFSIKLIRNLVKNVPVSYFQAAGDAAVEPNLISIVQSVKRDNKNKRREKLLGLNREQWSVIAVCWKVQIDSSSG